MHVEQATAPLSTAWGGFGGFVRAIEDPRADPKTKRFGIFSLTSHGGWAELNTMPDCAFFL